MGKEKLKIENSTSGKERTISSRGKSNQFRNQKFRADAFLLRKRREKKKKKEKGKRKKMKGVAVKILKSSLWEFEARVTRTLLILR